MTTIGASLAAAVERLTAAGVEQPRLDARLLLAHALDLTPEQVFAYPERPLDEDTRRAVEAVVQLRVQRRPVARITGRQEFWSLDFAVTDDTLIPRPDSETVIEAVLEQFPEPSAILDIGTGSGCLLLALLHACPGARGLGIDASDGALSAARSNADRLNLSERASFARADWGQGLADAGGGFDVIVCNPPYIADGDTESLAPEVANFEPSRALYAGPDGLDAYRTIIPQLPGLLGPEGAVFFEIGLGQADEVCRLLRDEGFKNTAKRRDLAGIDRCIIGFL